MFSGCGRPSLQGSRKRRETRTRRDNHRDLSFETLKFGPHRDNYRGSSTNADPTQTQQPTLEKLIKDIRQKVQTLSFSLPILLCYISLASFFLMSNIKRDVLLILKSYFHRSWILKTSGPTCLIKYAMTKHLQNLMPMIIVGMGQ